MLDFRTQNGFKEGFARRCMSVVLRSGEFWIWGREKVICIGKHYVVLNTTFGGVGICDGNFENDNIFEFG